MTPFEFVLNGVFLGSVVWVGVDASKRDFSDSRFASMARPLESLLATVPTGQPSRTAASLCDSPSRFASKTWQWVVGALILWIIVFPVYLFKRSNAPLKTA